jgi:hypothetical protein
LWRGAAGKEGEQNKAAKGAKTEVVHAKEKIVKIEKK